ncbi:Exosome complex component rrp4 [Glugoides intestinalis]
MTKSYLPGEYICECEGHIKGHGTTIIDGKITSMYFGDVMQINKLIRVIPKLTIRYTPEIGDVVVGRVIQIYNKKWKIDTNSKADTNLSLSAINLPGVMQRRKSEDDEINMCKFFDINDLIVCEVQKVSKTGNAALHTRNDKYGKLKNGVLVIISPDLLSPMKHRFISKENINIIGGSNGFIWISSQDLTPESFKRVSLIKTMIQNCYRENRIVDLESVINFYV